MDDDELFPRDTRPEDTNEGVRIIGAEEAEKAIEREDVARRLPQDARGSVIAPKRRPMTAPAPRSVSRCRVPPSPHRSCNPSR
jgi:hypothetical protein